MKTAEMLLWILGTTLLAVYAGARSWGEYERQESLISFVEARESSQTNHPTDPMLQARVAGATTARLVNLPAPDDLVAPAPDTVIAVLRIPGVKLEVPVYHGTADQVLRQGAGLVEGTAAPGSRGNIGIAAHRDSHFLALKNVAIGDLIELGTLEHTQFYRIIALSVVDPRDVHVLQDTGEPVLTLVTSYPFHFVGNAPQRFVVRAVAADGLM